jgi:hypothetical protein
MHNMADTETPDAGTQKPFLSDRHRNPAGMTARPVKKANNTWAGICAILATVIFIAMLVVLWMDWTEISNA